MADYSARTMYQEFFVKASYDCAQAVDYIIQHAHLLGVDPHNIVVQSNSIGAQAAKYISWVYHSFNVGLFTPRSLILDEGPIGFPENLNPALSVIAGLVGADFLLSGLTDQDCCEDTIGNQACTDGGFPRNTCNQTWHDITITSYCKSPGYDSVTIGDLVATQTFPIVTETCCDFSEGLALIWNPVYDMKANEYSSFYLMVCNPANCTSSGCLPHLGMYAHEYAMQSAHASINFTVYYTDYHGMAQGARGEKILLTEAHEPHVRTDLGKYGLEGKDILLNYLSSFNWRDKEIAQQTRVCSHAEAAAFVEFVTAQK